MIIAAKTTENHYTHLKKENNKTNRSISMLSLHTSIIKFVTSIVIEVVFIQNAEKQLIKL